MLPRWVTLVRGQDSETVAFTSGAALAMLDLVLRDPSGTLPGALLRDRMALDPSVACLRLENRREDASDIRDEVCLARAGEALTDAKIKISMPLGDFTNHLLVIDGRGRYLDNIFIERLWQSLKQEAVYLHEITDGFQAKRIIDNWIGFYNSERPHAALDKQTPNTAYFGQAEILNAA